jgi:hypothetical protein
MPSARLPSQSHFPGKAATYVSKRKKFNFSSFFWIYVALVNAKIKFSQVLFSRDTINLVMKIFHVVLINKKAPMSPTMEKGFGLIL